MARLPLGSLRRRRRSNPRGDAEAAQDSEHDESVNLDVSSERVVADPDAAGAGVSEEANRSPSRASPDQHETVERGSAESGRQLALGATEPEGSEEHARELEEENRPVGDPFDGPASDWFAADPPYPHTDRRSDERAGADQRGADDGGARRRGPLSWLNWPPRRRGPHKDADGRLEVDELSLPAGPPPAVTATDLVKRFGAGDTAVDALRGVTVSFAPGTFSAIMGPSGSGKSTLMHILAGLDRPTSGEVKLAGGSLAGLGDQQLTALRRTQVGFIFQAFNLVPVLSAEENVALPLSLSGKRADPDWVDELLEAVGLTDRRAHRPAQLSGGQQQRVAIARSLVTRPAVVFADEPTGNLDSESTEHVLALLRQATTQFGQTVVLVTHDPLAAAKADRVLFLDDGRIVRDAGRLTPEAILAVQRVG